MKDNILKTDVPIETEVLTTDQILCLSREKQEYLKTEIENIHICAFPNMGKEDLNIYIGDYFTKSVNNFQRQVVLFRNAVHKLIASIIFDFGEIFYEQIVMKGIYIISRTILPEYQKEGLGKNIAIKILTEFQPDLLFTTCAQSPSLHSWVGLVRKGLITGYEVYPRSDEKEMLISLPLKDFDLAINAFKQIYLGIVEGKQEDVDKAIRNLTVFMVRKDIYGERYDFNPWEKDGREDKLAKALGVTNKDGVLVIFRKKG